MCNQQGAPRYRYIEVQTDASTLQLSLKDESVLQEAKRIIAITAYRVGTVSNVPSGRPVVNDAVFKKSFLVLSTADTDEVFNKIPLSDLDRTANNGELYFVNIPPIAPTKCFIQIASVAGLNAGESFLLGFQYEK